jgi:hypothetical protein
MYSGVAQAAQTPLSTPGWSCSAHVATVNIGGPSAPTLDPLHANIDPASGPVNCADDGTTLPTLAIHDALGPNTLTLDGNVAQAGTALVNGGGPTGSPAPSPTYLQAPSAVGQTGNIYLNVGGSAGLTITAKAIRSYASAHCLNGAPVLESGNSVQYPSGRFPDGSQVGGQVLDLRINGTPIPADGQPDAALDQLFTGLSPLAPIVKVQLNKIYTTGDASTGDQSITREAVRIELLTAPGMSPLITIVLGSVTVDRHGATCTPPPGVTPPVINPVTFETGSNLPGSNGGGVFGGSASSGAGVTKTVFVGAPNGNNASECAHIRVFFDLERFGKPTSSGPTALSSRTGIRHVIRGVVRNCKGKPITKAKIELVNIIHGKRHLVKTGLRTRGGGKFTMITPNNYTSRTLEFQYRAFVMDPKIATRAHLRIKVRNFRGQLT